MEKISKRIISLFMAIVMVMGVLAVGFTVSAEDDDKTAYQNVKANEFYHDVGQYKKDEEGNDTDDFEKSGEEPHTYVEVIDETGNENNGDPVYLHPDYTGNTAFVCIECGHEKGESGKLDIHKQYIVKSDTEQAACESWPKETYRCRHCGGVYYVKTGMELGHYWPVELDNEDKPVTEEKEFEEYYKDPETGKETTKPVKKTVLKLKSDIEPVWDNDNNKCTIDLKCVRCGKMISYSVYTMSNETGRIYKTEETNPDEYCGKAVTYTAVFTIPNMAIDDEYEGMPYYYSTQVTEDTKDHTSSNPKEFIYNNENGVTLELKEDGIVKNKDDSVKTVDGFTVYSEGSLKSVKFDECTTDGSYDVYEICKECGEKFNKQTIEVKAPGHILDNPTVIKPTCTEDGYSIGTCKTCGKQNVIADEVPALGHSYEIKVGSTGATCEQAGTVTKRCIRCDETETKDDEAHPALGHNLVYTSNGDATCTIDGTKTGRCTRCSFTTKEADYGSALGHDWDDGVLYSKATCTEDEYRIYTCNRCSYKSPAPEAVYETALGHKWVTDCTAVKDKHEVHHTFVYCERCGEGYDNGYDTCKDLDFNFECDGCEQHINFWDHWLHYLIGWPMYHISKAIREFIKL